MTDLDPRITAAMHRSRPRNAAKVAREGLLTVGAVLGVLCLLALLASLALGVRPMVFRSGSMAPAIPTGALAFSHETKADDLAVGDIVSVITATGSRVTHRITEVSVDDGGVATLELQGDANASPDQEVYRVEHVDRVFLSAPRLGYVVGWLSGPAGIFLLGLYAAFLLSVLVKGSADSTTRPPRPGPPRPGPPRSGPPRSGRRRRRAAVPGRPARRRQLTMFGATVVLGVGGSFVSVPAAWATWTDPVPVTGTTLATVLPTAPVVVCGTLQIGSVTVNWTPVPSATGYRLFFGTGGATTVDVAAGVTSRTFTGTTGTFSVRAIFGTTSWLSPTSNSKQYSSLAGLLGTCI